MFGTAPQGHFVASLGRARSLRSLPRLTATRSRACLSLTASNLFPQDKQYDTKSQMLSMRWGTETRNVTNFQLTKRNVVDWGGDSAPDQRLSGLARERSERARPSEATKCPWGAVPSKNADFQSINNQLTVFLKPILGNTPANTRVLHLFRSRLFFALLRPTRVRHISGGLQSGWLKKHMSFLSGSCTERFSGSCIERLRLGCLH